MRRLLARLPRGAIRFCQPGLAVATSYLGIEVHDALEMAEPREVPSRWAAARSVFPPYPVIQGQSMHCPRPKPQKALTMDWR
jgi:hypothetical protein